jgi:S-DNA-T family DNA segregation ATPase FtsK/SpoIIIE
MMRVAEASGNEELVRQWEQRAYAYRFARHRRRMELLQMAVNAPKAIASAVGAGAGLLFALGGMLAWNSGNLGDVLTPLNAVIQFVVWVAFIAGVIWEPLLYALPLITLAGVWAVGCNQKTAPYGHCPSTATSATSSPTRTSSCAPSATSVSPR